MTRAAVGQMLDPTFQPIETRLGAGLVNYTSNVVECVMPDAQGRLLVAGRFDFLGTAPGGSITRLLPDGTVDPTFNPGGSGANGVIQVLRVLPNGKLLIGGQFNYYNNRRVGYFARLNADGTLDTTFNVGGAGADQRVLCITLDGQGRILLGGSFSYYNGQRVGRIVRLLPSGAIDATFASQQGGFTLTPRFYHPDSYVTAITIDRGGRLLVGGEFTAYDGRPRSNVARLLSSGRLDTTFFVSGLSGTASDIIELASGKILIGGSLNYYDPTASRMGLVRLEASGRLDTTFRQQTSGYSILAMIERANGKLLVGGLSGPTPSLAQLNANGTTDSQFPQLTIGGGVRQVRTLVELPTGQLVAGGHFQTLAGQPSAHLAVLTSTGSLDPGFRPPVFDHRAPVLQVVAQPDDRLLVRGAGSFNGQAVPRLVRLTPDGALDPTFQLDLAVPDLSWFTLGPNQQLYVVAGTHVRRLTSNGTLDPTFSDGTGFTATYAHYVSQVIVQPDGRLLVAGTFTQANGVARAGLVRLEADGSVDQQFVPAAAIQGYPIGIALRPDGHVLAWTNGSQSFASHCYCLDGATGALLPSFNNGQPVDSLQVAVSLPDTTALVLGPRGELFRLTAAGLPDPRFRLGAAIAGARFYGNFPTVLPNGKILVRTDYRSNPHLWCLNPDGSVDPRFTPVAVGTDYASTEALLQVRPQSTGDLILSGGFLNVGAVSRTTLVRLTMPLTGDATSGAVSRPGVSVYPNPTHDHLTLRRPTAETATATLLDVLGRPVRRWALTGAEETVSVVGLPAGAYVLRVVGATGVLTRKLVID